MYNKISEFLGVFPSEFEFLLPIILILTMLLIIYSLFYIYKITL